MRDQSWKKSEFWYIFVSLNKYSLLLATFNMLVLRFLDQYPQKDASHLLGLLDASHLLCEESFEMGCNQWCWRSFIFALCKDQTIKCGI